MTGDRRKAYSPPIYHGDQDSERLPYAGPPMTRKPDPANRGRKAPSEGSGVVTGSGAAAGGTSGLSEDFGTDSQSGSGPNIMPTPKKNPRR